MPKKSTVVVSARRAALGRYRPKQARRVGRPKADPASKRMGAVSAAAPLAVPSLYKTYSSVPDEIVRGTDFLSTVTLPSGTVDGKIVYNYFVSPTTVNARLGAIGRIWERYQFRHLSFKFVPAVPATTPGQLTFAYDPDCSDSTPTSYTRESLFSTDDNITASIYAPCVLHASHLDTHTLYYTNANSISADERLELQGQLYVAYTGPTLSAQMVAGTIMIEYEVYFTKRCYETSVPAPLADPTDTSHFADGDFDILSEMDGGLLHTLKGLGAKLDAGLETVATFGLMLRKGARLQKVVSLALEAISSNTGNLQYRITPVVKDALGQVIKYLSWCDGRLLHTVTESLTTEAGSVAYAVATTTGCEDTVANSNVDYFVGGVDVINRTSADLYLDFIVSFQYQAYTVTKLVCHGASFDSMPSFADFFGRYSSDRVFPNNEIQSAEPLPTAGSFVCVDPPAGLLPNPLTGASPAIGKGAAAAAPAPLSSPRRT